MAKLREMGGVEGDGWLSGGGWVAQYERDGWLSLREMSG